MTAKEFLRQLIDIDEQIRDYQDEILKVRTGMERMTPQMSGMPMGSPEPDKLAGHMDGLIAWEERLYAAVDEACRLKEQAMIMINKMSDQAHRKIIFKHYIAGKPFVLIAVEMHYSYHRTIHMHGEALRQFEVILQDSNF